MNNLKQYIRQLILFLCILIILVSIAGVIVVKLYGQEIKAYAINSLNKKLAVKVEVGKVELSFFRNFPQISILLENVIAFSSKDLNKEHFKDIQSDTLFKSKRIFLRFNTIEIIRGRYKIKRILAENGELTLLTDKSGAVNYKLFKSAPSTDDSGLIIDLELFRIKNFSFVLLNQHKEIHSSGKTDELILKGKFTNKNLNFTLMGKIFLDIYKREGLIWADKLNVDGYINMNAVDSVFTIKKGNITLNDLNLETTGKITAGQNLYTDLVIKGENLGIKSVVRILPYNFKKIISPYSADGRANLKVVINGDLSSIRIPSIKADYSISRGRIKVSGKPEISNISFNGSFSNGIIHTRKSSSFNFSNISGTVSKSTFTGSIYIENLVSPYIMAELKGEFHSPDINLFFTDNSIKFINGMIFPDLKISAKLSSFDEFDIRKIISSSLSGEISYNNTAIILHSSYPEITNSNGKISINNDSWLSEIRITSSSGDVLFKGRIDNVLKRFIHNNSSLLVHGNIYSNLTDLSFLLDSDDELSNSKPFLLPDKLFLKLELILDNFIMKKFRATSISAGLSYKPGFLSISTLKLNTMKGNLNGYGGLIQDAESNLIMKTTCTLSKLDINELFETFNNFNQDFITSVNLEGRISGQVDLSTNLYGNLIPDTKSTWSEASILIENGELKDFEPLRNLSRFIEVSELEHVKFQTLQNTFVIKNSKVYVPEMDIKSSAFNISASGEHGFDHQFNYNTKVNLSEILSKKALVKKENNEFVMLEKTGERVNIFLHIWGTPDNYKIRYDKREAKQQIREDIITEKKELKTILKEELGLFKKHNIDSTRKQNKEESPGYIMDWGDEEEAINDPKKKSRAPQPVKEGNGYKFDWN